MDVVNKKIVFPDKLQKLTGLRIMDNRLCNDFMPPLEFDFNLPCIHGIKGQGVYKVC